MSAIAGERIEKAPTSALTRLRLKWLAYATLGGLIALAGARYGYEWWSVGWFLSCATPPPRARPAPGPEDEGDQPWFGAAQGRRVSARFRERLGSTLL